MPPPLTSSLASAVVDSVCVPMSYGRLFIEDGCRVVTRWAALALSIGPRLGWVRGLFDGIHAGGDEPGLVGFFLGLGGDVAQSMAFERAGTKQGQLGVFSPGFGR